MKRIFKRIVLTLALIFSLVLVASCTRKVKTVTEVKMSEDSPSEILIGTFTYDDFSFVVSYSDGTQEVVKVDESMISVADFIKTYHEGPQTITISYGDIEFSYILDIKLYEFDVENIHLIDCEYTYDGLNHSIEIEGDIPKGTTIVYSNNNEYRDAHEYTVTATLANDKYITTQIQGKLTIKKAEYDTTGIEFNNKSFVYDGNPKSISLENAPKDLNISYSINKVQTNQMTDVGVYEVIANIDAGPNYATVPQMKATMTITKGTYDMSAFNLYNNTVVFDGETHHLKLTNAEKLPNGVSYMFVNNEGIDAGTYDVTCKFVGDYDNYFEIEDMHATLTITKAKYTLPSSMYLASQEVAYDSLPHYLHISEEPPVGIIADGYVNNGQTEVGEYIVYAKFRFRDERDANNYEEITPLKGTLRITKSDLDGLVFTDQSVDWDSKGHSIKVSRISVYGNNLPSGVTVQYKVYQVLTDGSKVLLDGTNVVEPGTYLYVPTFSLDERAANNYNLPELEGRYLTINKISVQTGFTSQHVKYDNTLKTLTAEVTGPIKDYITVTYMIDGPLGTDNKVPFTGEKEPGSYLIYAYYSVLDSFKEEFELHYKDFVEQSAYLYIDKLDYTPVYTNQKLSLSDIASVPVGDPVVLFNFSELPSQTFDYSLNETTKNPHLAFESIIYTNIRQRGEGIYLATAEFTLTEEAKKYYNDIPRQEFYYAIRGEEQKPLNITVLNQTVEYDGLEHSIIVSNLPDCVSVEYFNNKQVLPGKHPVQLIFSINNDVAMYYYKLPLDEDASEDSLGTFHKVAGDETKRFVNVQLTIEKALVDLTFNNDQDFIYDGTQKSISWLDNYSWISVSYEYEKDASGALIDRIKPRLDGDYSVKVIPQITDPEMAKLYRVEEETIYFNIKRATLAFNICDLSVYYDGYKHKVRVDGVPTGEDGFEITIIGDDQVKVGEYPVEIHFTNNSDCYNDIPVQYETLTIMNNVLNMRDFVTYISSEGVKNINQFQTLKGFFDEWFTTKGFDIEWSVDYFKSVDQEYPLSSTTRHGSSDTSDDFTFFESTSNDEYVIVTFMLKFKEGYVCGDQSMNSEYSGMIMFHVGKSTVIDLSSAIETLSNSYEVVQGTYLEEALKALIPEYNLLDLRYTADYYCGDDVYDDLSKYPQSHGESSYGRYFEFAYPTFGDRYVAVTMVLDAPNGYAFYDGSRSFMIYSLTFNVSVNPTYIIDSSYLEAVDGESISVDQYHKLSSYFESLIDTRYVNLTWSVVSGEHLFNQGTDLLLSDSTMSFQIDYSLSAKEGYALSCGHDLSGTFNLSVNAKEVIDFSSFEAQMNEINSEIYQYFDYFTEVISDVVFPEDTSYIIKIEDVNGKVTEFSNFNSYEFSNPSKDGKKVKVTITFTSLNDKLILDSNGVAVDCITYTYEYTILESIIIDTSSLYEISNTYNLSTIDQFSSFDMFYTNKFLTLFDSYPITFKADIYYKREIGKNVYSDICGITTLDSIVSSKSYKFNTSYGFSKNNEICVVTITLSLPTNTNYIFSVTNKYSIYVIFRFNIREQELLNSTLFNTYNNTTINVPEFSKLYDVYKDMEETHLTFKSWDLYREGVEESAAHVAGTYSDEYIFKYITDSSEDVEDILNKNIKVVIKYQIESGYITYDKDSEPTNILTLTLYINITDRKAITIVNLSASSAKATFNSKVVDYINDQLLSNITSMLTSSYNYLSESVITWSMQAKYDISALNQTYTGNLTSDKKFDNECISFVLTLKITVPETYKIIYSNGTLYGDGINVSLTYSFIAAEKIDSSVNYDFWTDKEQRYISSVAFIKYLSYGYEDLIESGAITIQDVVVTEISSDNSQTKYTSGFDTLLTKSGYDYWVDATYVCSNGYYFSTSNNKYNKVIHVTCLNKYAAKPATSIYYSGIESQFEKTRYIKANSRIFNFPENNYNATPRGLFIYNYELKNCSGSAATGAEYFTSNKDLVLTLSYAMPGITKYSVTLSIQVPDISNPDYYFIYNAGDIIGHIKVIFRTGTVNVYV